MYKEQKLLKQLQYVSNIGLDKDLKLLKKFQNFTFETSIVNDGFLMNFSFDNIVFFYSLDLGSVKYHLYFEKSYSMISGKTLRTYKEGIKGIKKATEFIDLIENKLNKLSLTERGNRYRTGYEKLTNADRYETV